MKTALAVLSLVVCLGLAVSARSVPNAPDNMTEDDFRKLEQAWLEAAAVPDLPSLEKMFADDFMGTSFGGGVLNKGDVVPAPGLAANHMPKSKLGDSTVRIFGDTAVLMGAVEMQVPQNTQRIRMTTVFQKRGENWQVIAVHMSKALE